MALAANERCVPPLSVDELRGQVEGAVRWVEKQDEDDAATETAATFLEEVLRGNRDVDTRAHGHGHGEGVARAGGSSGAARPPRSRRAPVEWLIPNVVPIGTLVAGRRRRRARQVRARARLGGRGHPRRRQRARSSRYEDAAEQVIRPRFEALGGDLDRLYELSVDPLEGSISFPTDLDELDRHARETEARLIVIDPVSASIDLKLDAHKDQDVRVVLGQLAKLAERRGSRS